MTLLAFADDLSKPCRYCAPISYVQTERLTSQPVPDPTEPTATVTFIQFRDRTYAVTAAHVVNSFRASVPDPQNWTFFIPTAPGHTLFDHFYQPPAEFLTQRPDAVIRRIDPGLPPYLGKEAFLLTEDAQPDLFPYALAVGYPTARKKKLTHDDGWQVAMECCQAAAEGISRGTSDQVQFYSEIHARPEITSLSGMSGGPVLWSDGTMRGLIGIVKEAMSNEESEHTLGGGPKVHFICQRFSAAEFAVWTAGIE